MRRNEKGITLVSLIITVIVLLILSGVVIYSVSTSPSTRDLMRMRADLELLRDRVLTYYNNHGQLPITGNEITEFPATFPRTQRRCLL